MNILAQVFAAILAHHQKGWSLNLKVNIVDENLASNIEWTDKEILKLSYDNDLRLIIDIRFYANFSTFSQ